MKRHTLHDATSLYVLLRAFLALSCSVRVHCMHIHNRILQGEQCVPYQTLSRPVAEFSWEPRTIK